MSETPRHESNGSGPRQHRKNNGGKDFRSKKGGKNFGGKGGLMVVAPIRVRRRSAPTDLRAMHLVKRYVASEVVQATALLSPKHPRLIAM